MLFYVSLKTALKTCVISYLNMGSTTEGTRGGGCQTNTTPPPPTTGRKNYFRPSFVLKSHVVETLWQALNVTLPTLPKLLCFCQYSYS